MKLLVTGAAGFIGSHFVLRHCDRARDDHIVVLDKLTYAADRTFLDPVMERITFVEGDIADQKLVDELVRDYGIDTIVNFAAESHVDNSITEATPFLHTNIIGVQALIEVCKQHPITRLLHISTDEVYGDVDDDDPPCDVGSRLAPSSPYAASKAAGEMLVLAAMRTFGIKAAITRCTNNFGPHQAEEKFMPTVIRCALRDQPVPIYAEGKNKRDWIYVTDHCDAIEKVLATPWAFSDESVPGTGPGSAPGSGHLFNIAGGNEWRNIDVAKKILDLIGKPHDLLTFVQDRLGHDWRYAVDDAPTRVLGWKPNVGFDEGLDITIAWYSTRYSSK